MVLSIFERWNSFSHWFQRWQYYHLDHWSCMYYALIIINLLWPLCCRCFVGNFPIDIKIYTYWPYIWCCIFSLESRWSLSFSSRSGREFRILAVGHSCKFLCRFIFQQFILIISFDLARLEHWKQKVAIRMTIVWLHALGIKMAKNSLLVVRVVNFIKLYVKTIGH